MGVDDAGMFSSDVMPIDSIRLGIQNTHRGYFILNDLNESIPDLTCPALVDFSAQFERPLSPDQAPPPAPMEMTTSEVASQSSEESDDDDYPWPEELTMDEPKLLAPPPTLDVPSVRVIYFDVYSTLIVCPLHPSP
jgi:hypothetical protein